MTHDAANDDYTHMQTFHTGDRVELHPGCDLWMRGAKFGTIHSRVSHETFGTCYRVRMENTRVRRLQLVQPDRLRKVGR